MVPNDKYEVKDQSKLSVTLTIRKIDASINVTDNQEKVYNGSNQEPTVSSWVGNSISKSFSRDGGNTYSTTAPNEAITYKVKYTITGGINYNDVETIVNFKITQANPVISWPTLTGTYYEGNSVSTTGTAVSGVSGSWSNAGIVYGQWIDGETRNDGIVYANYGYVNGNNALPSKIYVTFKQTNNSNYLSEVSAWIDINVLPVAYNGTYYYGTIEKALLDSNTTLTDSTNASITTGTTIYVIPGTNPTIKNDATVKANTSLILPYEGETYSNRYGTGYGFADSTETSANVNRKNNVTLARNVNLNIESNGKLCIGGVLGNTEYEIQGATSGSYTQITLNNNAGINNAGTIECYGYIKEASETTTGAFVNNSYTVGSTTTHGTIYMPFVIYDYRGGSHTAGAYKAEPAVSPFSEYDLPNIQTSLTVNYGGTIMGYVDIYTNNTSINVNLGLTTVTAVIPSRHNLDEVTIISNNSKGLFNVDSGSVTFRYTPSWVTSEINANKKVPLTVNDDINGITQITVSNASTFGLSSLTLSIQAAEGIIFYLGSSEISEGHALYNTAKGLVENILNTTISTDNVFFPIPWKYNIEVLNGGTFNINSKTKFLTGSSVTIQQGATLNVNNNTIFYQYFDDIIYTSVKPHIQYPDRYNNIRAELNVGGTVNVASGVSFGAYINGISTSAKLNLNTSSLSVSSTECHGIRSGTNFSHANEQTISVTTKGKICINGLTASDSNFTSGIWRFNGTGWYTAGNATITFNPNYGSLTGGTSSSTTTSVTITDGSGFTIPTYGNQGIAAPTHYYFDGWYLDSSCNTLASGKAIWSNTTLYAKWTPITYTIEYVFDYGQYEGSIDTSSYTDSFTCLTDDFVLATPNVENYTFDGWYLDTTYTTNNKLTSFNFERVAGSISNNKVTLYARLLSESININFITNNSDYDDFIVENVPADLETIRNVSIWNNGDISKDNENTQYSKYFYGWYYDDGDNRILVDSLSNVDALTDAILNAHISNLTDITIYGVWEDKVHIIYNDYQNGVTDYSTVCDDIYVKASEVSSYSLPDINDNNDVDTYSHYFYGWYKEQSHTNIYSSTIGTTPSPGDTINIYGYWVAKAKITYKYITGDGLIDSLSAKEMYRYILVDLDSPKTYNVITTLDSDKQKVGYTFKGWGNNHTYTEGETLITSFTVVEDVVLYAKYIIDTYTVTFNLNSGTGTISNQSVEYYGKVTEPSTTPTRNNYNFKGWFKDSSGQTSWDFNKDIVISNTTIYAGWERSCLIEGTLITMSDGTTKPVEDIVAGDEVLVFNHYTGTYDTSIVIYNVHDTQDYDYYSVNNLVFSDGTIIKIHSDHYFFDLDLNKYVLINEINVQEFINHKLYYSSYDNQDYQPKEVTLVNSYITNEYTRVFGPITYGHLNCFANGLLNIAGDNDPFINIFEYNESMKYNEELMKQDIETYGLFTYEDFKDYISEDIYNAYQGQYLKVAIGKGYTTFDRIIELINKYLNDMGYGNLNET